MAPISTETFLAMCYAIQAANPSYKKGHDGSDGLCDCIGLIIGAIRRSGGDWTNTHGSNYAARYAMQELVSITSAAQLQPGMAVYKRYMPGDAKYALPAGYKSGTDQGDYYHVGVVISVAPMQIMHCTGWTGSSGIKIDTVLGNWKWGGRLKKVAYAGQEGMETVMDTLWIGKVIGGRLSLRVTADKDNDAGRVWIPDGAQVKVLDKAALDGWVFVEYEGKQGYCVKQFLECVQDNISDGLDRVTLVLNESTARELLEALTKAVW